MFTTAPGGVDKIQRFALCKKYDKVEYVVVGLPRVSDHYAKIAEETKCEMLCLGCEMESTEEFEIRWRNLIMEIRQIYHGPITYNLNHGREKILPGSTRLILSA
jgi:hypothetical protein